MLFICALGLLAAGCGIPVEPEEEGDPMVMLTLNISFDQAMPDHTSISYKTKASAPLARYTVCMYTYDGDKYTTRNPLVFSATGADLNDRSYTINVQPLNYHVEVWADWIEDGTPFYNVEDFSAVAVNTDPYTGASYKRDAFCGEMDLDLSGYKGKENRHEASITLARPNSRFSIVSTDREQFLDHWAGEVALSDGTYVKDIDAIDLSAFKVRVYYSQYMPSKYNLHEGVVCDSATGVWFDTYLSELPDGTIQIAWDWVFTGGKDSSVVVSVEIYDPEGNVINRLDDIMIPLSPGQVSTVTGSMLTSHLKGGITVDPSFNGEYIVHLN